MFVPLILPFKITCCVILVLMLGLALPLRRLTKYWIAATLGIGLVLWLPVFVSVWTLADSIRYGEFHYNHARQIDDRYVDLPSDATEIILHRFGHGHELKFKTSRESLEAWMGDVTNKIREYSDAHPFELELPRKESPSFDFDSRFERHGWRYPPDALFYRGWRSRRGAGLDVWYSESEQTGYVSAGYW